MLVNVDCSGAALTGWSASREHVAEQGMRAAVFGQARRRPRQGPRRRLGPDPRHRDARRPRSDPLAVPPVRLMGCGVVSRLGHWPPPAFQTLVPRGSAAPTSGIQLAAPARGRRLLRSPRAATDRRLGACLDPCSDARGDLGSHSACPCIPRPGGRGERAGGCGRGEAARRASRRAAYRAVDLARSSCVCEGQHQGWVRPLGGHCPALFGSWPLEQDRTQSRGAASPRRSGRPRGAVVGPRRPAARGRAAALRASSASVPADDRPDMVSGVSWTCCPVPGDIHNARAATGRPPR